jgi:arabinose-5-phosphate isomerase
MLGMGDALAMALQDKRGFKEEEYARLHPGGKLGVRLRRVEQVMHKAEQVPRVRPYDKMPEVIYEMSKKGLGVTTVVNEGDRLAGVISDGDLRRFLQKKGNRALDLTAADAMTNQPVTVGPNELATKALHLMEARKITSLVVTGDRGRVVGLVHIHDLWTTQMF